MGWFGYDLYDGDDTQIRHVEFIKQAIPSLKNDEIANMLHSKKTEIPIDLLPEFKKGIKNILQKIKYPENILSWNDDIAIEWQMLLSLFVDNNLIIPNKIMIYGMLANYYLLVNHSDEFNLPYKRKNALKTFIQKVEKNFCSTSILGKISKMLEIRV